MFPKQSSIQSIHWVPRSGPSVRFTLQRSSFPLEVSLLGSPEPEADSRLSGKVERARQENVDPRSRVHDFLEMEPIWVKIWVARTRPPGR